MNIRSANRETGKRGGRFPQLDRLADYKDEGRPFSSRSNRTYDLRTLPIDKLMRGEQAGDEADDL